MSLSTQDETQILNWFEEKQKYQNTDDLYFKYRDLIFGSVLTNLADYFSILKADWKTKHHLSEDDCISIVHDGLLAAVDNFKLHFKSRSGVKFITYLTNVLHNLAMDYARRNHVRYNGTGLSRKQRNMGKIPSSMYVSLDSMLGNFDRGQEPQHYKDSFVNSAYIDSLFKFMEEKEDHFSSQTAQKLFVQNLLSKLSEGDRFILQSIMDGNSLSAIAKELELTRAGIKYRIKRLSKKFADLKKELWASEKQL